MAVLAGEWGDSKGRHKSVEVARRAEWKSAKQNRPHRFASPIDWFR